MPTSPSHRATRLCRTHRILARVTLALGVVAGCEIPVATAGLEEAPDDVEVAHDGGGLIIPVEDEAEEPIQAVTAWIETGEGGEADEIVVAIAVHPGWWIHSLDQHGGETEDKRTVIEIAADSPRRPADRFVPDTRPFPQVYSEFEELADVVFEEHHGVTVWRAPLRPAARANDEFRGEIRLQADGGGMCAPPVTFGFVARPLADQP